MNDKKAVCKITVIKITVNEDIIKEYLEEQYHNITPCNKLKLGDEYFVTDLTLPPVGFCEWAWADIKKDILIVASGGNPPGMRKKGSVIAGCTDWLRPVSFLIERL